jgi:hypothetical protein
MHRLKAHDLTQGCLALEQTFSGTKKLHHKAMEKGRSKFKTATAETKAQLLAELPATARIRADLIEALISTRGEPADHALIEVAVRLWKAGKPDPALDARVAKLLRRSGEAASRARLDKSLRSNLDKLIAGQQNRGWLARWLRRDKRE